MNSLTISSPAKVNLFLKILGKRRGGYHNLYTLFHRISLADTLTLQKIPSGIRIQTNITNLPTGSGNLIWKAFYLLQKSHPFRGGVLVNLKKQIPVGAGLGGGSSNAASFLLGVKKLYRLKISNKKLRKIGSKLGADVNFFLTESGQSIGTGIGDQLRPLSSGKRLWFVVVTFPKLLSTAKVYRLYGLRHSNPRFLTKENRVVKLAYCFRTGNLHEMQPFLENDLQAASVKLYAPIGRALQLFDELGVRTRAMSGSGPTVFAVVGSRARAEKLAKQVRARLRPYKKIFISHTL